MDPVCLIELNLEDFDLIYIRHGFSSSSHFIAMGKCWMKKFYFVAKTAIIRKIMWVYNKFCEIIITSHIIISEIIIKPFDMVACLMYLP